MKNEIDERFEVICTKIREVAVKVLRQHVYSKNPQGSRESVEQKIDALISSQPLPLELVKDLAAVLIFGEQEQARFVRILTVRSSIVPASPGQTSGSLQSIPKDSQITFSKLLDYLIDYKLRLHSELLSKLKDAFRQFDIKNSGFVSKKQLSKLFSQLNKQHLVPTDKLEELAKNVPWDLINFSDLVESLAAKTVTADGGQVSYLKALSGK